MTSSSKHVGNKCINLPATLVHKLTYQQFFLYSKLKKRKKRKLELKSKSGSPKFTFRPEVWMYHIEEYSMKTLNIFVSSYTVSSMTFMDGDTVDIHCTSLVGMAKQHSYVLHV